MRIKYLEIKNFKSIVKIKLEEIPNFAVFAGANGSGKSNFFEALEFVRDIIKNGSKDAIKKHGGYEHIHSHKLRDKNAKRFYFKIVINLDNELFEYELEIKNLNKSPILVEFLKKEDIVIAKRSIQQNIFIDEKKVDIDYSEYESILKLVSQKSYKLFNFLSTIQRYQIDPNRAREADEYFANDILDSNATNLTTVLSNLQKSSETAEEIVETMSMIVPGLEKIKTEKEKLSNKTIVTFKEKNIRKNFPAGLVSDGTIYALAMLVIIYSNKNGIILIEEPERGLNPKAIAELVELFREKSEEFSIFINTHSESVVRVSKAEELFIVNKDEGKTTIKNVKKEYPKYEYNKFNLDEMWMSNMFGGGLPW